MTRPLVSVMLPCFNAAETLAFALASLLAQSIDDWECVCLDDGSTDSTFQILQHAASRDARFRVERFETNRGRGAARQRVLELVTGKYLAFLDADDWMYPERLQHEIEWLEIDHRIAAVTVCCAVTDGVDRLVGLMKPLASHRLPEVAIFDRMQLPPLLFPASMIRTDIAQATGFDPAFKRSQDSDFVVRALFDRHYALSSKVLYAYSKSGASLERSLDGYRYRMRTHARGFRDHPLDVSRTLAATAGKMLVYRVAGAMGIEQKLIDRRHEPADDETRRGFPMALEAVRTKHRQWYG